MKDVEIIIVHNDALTAFQNSVNRGKQMGRFLGINYFLESFQNRTYLIRDIIDGTKDLGVNVNIRTFDNTGNKGRGEIPVKEAIDTWDYNTEPVIIDILKYIDNEIHEGRLTKDQATAITGDIRRLSLRNNPEVGRLATSIAERVQAMGTNPSEGNASGGLGIESQKESAQQTSTNNGNGRPAPSGAGSAVGVSERKGNDSGEMFSIDERQTV